METEDILPPPLPLPLEDRERYPGFWTRVGKTLALGFTAPMDFFQRVPRGEGVGAPLGLALLLSVPMYLFMSLYAAALGFMGLVTRLAPTQGPEPPFRWLALGCLGAIVVMPLFQVLAFLCSALVQCLFLRLWGVHAPDIPLEQDGRAWIYTQAFMTLAAWTPLGPIAMCGVLVVAGLGFARMHRAPAWRGVAATLTPPFLTLVALAGGLILVVSRIPARPPRPPQSQAYADLMEKPGMSPEAVMSVHIDQARLTLNGLTREAASPEEAVTQALRVLPRDCPPATNPYDRQGPAFRSGPPQALGEVGLTALHDYQDGASSLRFKSGVAVEAWTRNGRVKRWVVLAGG